MKTFIKTFRAILYTHKQVLRVKQRCSKCVNILTPRQIAAILQTTYSNPFSRMKTFCLWFLVKLNWYMILMDKPALVQVMALRLTGDKPLSEPMMVLFTDAYIGVTQSQWVLSMFIQQLLLECSDACQILRKSGNGNISCCIISLCDCIQRYGCVQANPATIVITAGCWPPDLSRTYSLSDRCIVICILANM